MARRAAATPSSCSPRHVVALARLHSALHVLAVAIDQREQFAARLGMAVHAEQHRGAGIAKLPRCRGRARWRGAARPRLRRSRLERASTSPRKCTGNGASGASAAAASSASIASSRRPSRSSNSPRAVISTAFSGSASRGNVQPGQQGFLGPRGGRGIDTMQRVRKHLRRQLLRLGEGGFGQRGSRRSHASARPSVSQASARLRRDAAAAQQQVARASRHRRA